MKKIIVIFLFLGCISQSFSQISDTVKFKTDSVLVLKESIVYGVRAEKLSPITFTNIDRKEIQSNYTGQDVGILLSRTPAITFYTDGGNNNGYMYIRMRGIDQTRINMTLNGIPLNEPEDQGAYFSNYTDFLNNVNSIQIQRGVGMSNNGIASYAGSVNFESINLLDTSFNVNLNGGYGSFNTHKYSASINTGKSKKGFSAYARYSNLSSNGYRNNSGTNANTFFFSGGYFGKKDVVILTSFIGHSKNQMAYLASPEDTLKVNPTHNPLTRDEKDDFMQNFNSLQYKRYLTSNSSISVSAFYNRLIGNYDVLFAPDMLNFQLSSHYYGGILNYSISDKLYGLVVGFSASGYERTHMLGIKPYETQLLYKNTGYKWDINGFIKGELKLKKVNLYVDLQIRNTNFTYAPETSYNLKFDAINWFFMNPRVGVSYLPNKNIKLYAFAGYTGREPTRNDMFAGFDDIDSSNYQDIGDFSKVKPESVINGEIGFNFENNKKNFSLSTNVYYMHFFNEITAIGKLSYIGLPLRKNVKESFRTGIEMELKYAPIKNLLFDFNGTYMYANIKEYTNDETGEVFKNVRPLLTPDVILNSGINYTFLKNYSFGVTCRYVSSSFLDNTSNDTYKLPDSYVLNLIARINVTKHLNIILNLNNFSNSKYYNAGYVQSGSRYFYMAPGINFFANINVNI